MRSSIALVTRVDRRTNRGPRGTGVTAETDLISRTLGGHRVVTLISSFGKAFVGTRGRRVPTSSRLVGEDGRREEGKRAVGRRGVKVVSNKPHFLFSTSRGHPTHPTEHVILHTVRLYWTGNIPTEPRTPQRPSDSSGSTYRGSDDHLV